MITNPLLYKEEDFLLMSRNKLTKEEIKTWVEQYKNDLYDEPYEITTDSKSLAHKYLNKILDKINEFREY
jgi:hypothetical protein